MALTKPVNQKFAPIFKRNHIFINYSSTAAQNVTKIIGYMYYIHTVTSYREAIIAQTNNEICLSIPHERYARIVVVEYNLGPSTAKVFGGVDDV